MVQLNDGHGKKDDIDHLGNRRVRSVGELIQQQFRVGLLRMERVIKERMAIVQDPRRPRRTADQHSSGRGGDERVLRRQPALTVHGSDEPAGGDRPQATSLGAWPWWPSRERAGFDVRDVHHSHYGRICPIETPEGPNIGLIGNMATYAQINPYGFIETPYRKVYHELPANDPRADRADVRCARRWVRGKAPCSARTRGGRGAGRELREAGRSRRSPSSRGSRRRETT